MNMMDISKLLIGLFGIICMTTQAQTTSLDYRPFVEEGKTWEIQVGGIEENIYGNRIDGDTLINGKKWSKVYNYVFLPEFGYSYYACLREEGKKVYAIAKGSTRPRLLYNFDLKVGDVLSCGVEGNTMGCLIEGSEQCDTLLGFPFKTYLKVERIDTLMIRKMKRRCFTFTILDAYREPMGGFDMALLCNVIWIEGVGSSAGPFSPWMQIPRKGCIGSHCADADRNFIAGINNFYNISELTPIEDTHYVRETKSPSFDLQGRRLTRQPAKGVYIQDGKKRVR